MKKIFCLLLICIMALFITACENEKVTIEGHEWRLRTAANLENENLIVAVGEKDEEHLDAKVVDVVLTAENGEFVITDKTNNKTYVGAYEEMYVTNNSEDYKIILKGKDGYATVAYTTYDDGTKELTLPVTIGGYDMYFYVNN